MGRRAASAGSRSTTCPCGGGAPYEGCCEPLHRGEREADDAVRLMRARYAAFARQRADYLWRTLHAEHDDRARGEAEVLRELERACRAVRYRRLEILASHADGATARVLFRAELDVGGEDRSFVELSDFLHDGTGWRYLCGATLPAAEAAAVRSFDAFWRVVQERPRRPGSG